MKHFLLFSFILTALMFCGCASSEKPPAQPQQEEDPVIAKAKEEWKNFVAKKQEEERNRHDLNTLQNDRDRVFPWREGRRSERLHERRDSSIFSLW